MMIYENNEYSYDTLDLLYNEPCEINGIGRIYPITVYEYREFLKYTPYLILSKEHLKLKDDTELLQSIIVANISSLLGGKINLSDERGLGAMKKVMGNLERLFCMVTKRDIVYRVASDGGFEFVEDKMDSAICINSKNFNTLRNVLLLMNLIKEPKYFEDELMQKWYNKYKIARQKNNKSNLLFEDVIIAVSQDMKIPLKEIKKLNILQLYSYYYRANHIENYKTAMLFKTVSDKVPNINYMDSIVELLYKDGDEDMFVDANGLASKM